MSLTPILASTLYGRFFWRNRPFLRPPTFSAARHCSHSAPCKYAAPPIYAMTAMTEDPLAITVPEGFTLHTENTSHILLPATNEAFINPVQEFNRDLSVAAIRVWSEELNREREGKWRRALERQAKASGPAGRSGKKRRKLEDGSKVSLAAESEAGSVSSEAASEPSETSEVPMESSDVFEKPQAKSAEYRPYRFVLLEALSATGLRSIRYAKEIPLVKHVIANDLSPMATAAMKRNVDLNGLGTSNGDAASSEKPESHDSKPAKVRINESDARSLMYAHSLERNRVDVVDLDPYGTAAPFIDAAVQCINDGGLLCVTCTDLSVLATNNYPEKCYSNYGGVPVKAEYCHEAALRLVLHTISTSAARYGRFIQPMLSLSIDFYVRLFVKVQSAPIKVKEAASQTSVYYVCSTCQSFYGQSFGKKIEKVNERSGNINILFKTQTGPPVSEKCPECDSAMHLGGPMWAGPIHDHGFTAKLLQHVEANESKYGTSTRMKGMLTVANEELDVPFYFTPSRVASFFHCTCPPLDDVASALLNAGHKISRSHACPGSLKTTAPRDAVYDVFRSWIRSHPVKMEKISENSPSRKLLDREAKFEASFKHHPETVTRASKVKVVRYQQNPTPHWGPGTRADSGTKRNRSNDED